MVFWKYCQMNVQQVKQRFGIIGNHPALNRAIDIALQVAPTDLSVLIGGESGTGKEFFPKIIHQYSSRKHGNYIAVNCGAIPEGTIDSELFGHEKGAFTGATDSRKGYFEESSGGTIFLDEIAELPLSTQVRLLRVLESGEFIRVGSSKVQKIDVRVIAATNINIIEAIQHSKFREDLYYRLNTVPINIPSLRERKEDIHLLFRKFASDFAETNRMPSVTLTEDARKMLTSYRWPGNIRQLKNTAEQMSIIESERVIGEERMSNYLPDYQSVRLPAIYEKPVNEQTFNTEREILYKVLFDMKNDMQDMKKLVAGIIDKGPAGVDLQEDNARILEKLYPSSNQSEMEISHASLQINTANDQNIQDTEEIVEESLSLKKKEIELIIKSLEKHRGKRKYAAKELGISERTLYRKIKEHNLE